MRIIQITHFGEFEAIVRVDEELKQVAFEGPGSVWVEDHVRGQIRPNSLDPQGEVCRQSLMLLETMHGFTSAFEITHRHPSNPAGS